jgi:hypothetical protein
MTILFNIIYFKDPEQSDGVPYPGWGIALSWLIALSPVVGIPGWFLYKYCTEGGWQVNNTQIIKSGDLYTLNLEFFSVLHRRRTAG